jgi:hypothetical protein
MTAANTDRADMAVAVIVAKNTAVPRREASEDLLSATKRGGVEVEVTMAPQVATVGVVSAEKNMEDHRKAVTVALH